MDKGKLHHWWRKIRQIKPWYLLVLAVISGVICVNALRQNNLKMIELRKNVYAVDKANGDIEKALRELREFVYAHMNTNLSSDNGVKPPIQLAERYKRLVEAEKKRVGSANDKIYTDAQSYCEAKIPTGFSGSYRLECIKQYVDSHTVKEKAIDDSLYKFDFVSPIWSPDLAGWSMVLTAVLLLLFVVRFAIGRWVDHELHDHL